MKNLALLSVISGAAADDLGICDPLKYCKDWDCDTWCDCFENPLVAAFFEETSEHYDDLQKQCPEDDEICECGASKAAQAAKLDMELPPIDGAIRAQNGAPIIEGVDFIAEVAYDGKWYEICGHYAWDDKWTATAACKNVGFMDGTTNKTKRHILPNYGMRVGKCGGGDDSVVDCKRGGNDYGDLTIQECEAGKKSGIMIKCTKRVELMLAENVEDGAIRAYGDETIVEDTWFSPEVAHNGRWFPICENGAWNDYWTATAACKSLGYLNGEQKGTGERLWTYSMRVGRCGPTDNDVTNCTRGANNFGDYEVTQCNQGSWGGMQIKCFNHMSVMDASGIADGKIRGHQGAAIQAEEWFSPEVAHNGRWFPICGHYAWDDYWTATAACKSLGYLNGEQKKTDEKLWTFSMRVGKCGNNDNDVTKCKRGGNSFGEYEVTQCNQGMNGGMEIMCSNHMSIMDAEGVKDGSIRGDRGAAIQTGEWFMPEVAFNGRWYPMCGLHAWDDEWTATAACKSLGYSKGQQKRNEKRETLWTQAMQVGKCSRDDVDVTNCKRGGNNFGKLEVGSFHGQCEQGNGGVFHIMCE